MSHNQTSSKELFRYATITQPKIIDLNFRASKIGGLKQLLGESKSNARKDWARHLVSKGSFKPKFDYFSN